ncbi:hypothetical protein CKA32_005383 [Geitlerinema sp. FC II]|nr:hypothetical protein CKA32_005383 [Geitlerinema sp. FC II]
MFVSLCYKFTKRDTCIFTEFELKYYAYDRYWFISKFADARLRKFTILLYYLKYIIIRSK